MSCLFAVATIFYLCSMALNVYLGAVNPIDMHILIHNQSVDNLFSSDNLLEYMITICKYLYEVLWPQFIIDVIAIEQVLIASCITVNPVEYRALFYFGPPKKSDPAIRPLFFTHTKHTDTIPAETAALHLQSRCQLYRQHRIKASHPVTAQSFSPQHWDAVGLNLLVSHLLIRCLVDAQIELSCRADKRGTCSTSHVARCVSSLFAIYKCECGGQQPSNL